VIDVDKHPEPANDFDIDVRVTSVALPTIILFKDGREISRLPRVPGEPGDDADDEDSDEEPEKEAERTIARLSWDRSPVRRRTGNRVYSLSPPETDVQVVEIDYRGV
jgi:hypothetical protein